MRPLPQPLPINPRVDLITPPNEIEAEEAVLGSLLIAPESLIHVMPFLDPEMFYVVKNGWVYQAILNIARRSQAIDTLTVASELARDGRLQEIGGESYLAQLVNTVPTALNVETYGRMVEEMYIRRQLLESCSLNARLAFDKTTPIGKVINDSQSSVVSATASTINKKRLSLKQAINARRDMRVRRLYEDEGERFTVSHADLDAKLGDSLERNRMLVVKAPRKSGKSTHMCNVAVANARRGFRVCYFSNEEEETSFVERAVAHIAQTDLSTPTMRRLLNEGSDDFDRKRQLEHKAETELEQLPVTPYECIGWTIEMILQRAKLEKLTAGLDILIIDYAQLIVPSGEQGNREQELAYISRTAKTGAKELDCLLVLGAQVNHDGITRESSAFEMDASACYLIDGKKNRIIVDANRWGASGEVAMFYDKATFTIGAVMREGLL